MNFSKRKTDSYHHATTRANPHPFHNLTLYISTKVMFTAVFTMSFTQRSSQFLNTFFKSEFIDCQVLLLVYKSIIDTTNNTAPMLPKLQIMNINYINTYLMLACK